jgi:hypothetical protein
MPRPRKDDVVKQFSTCIEALDFIDKLRDKKIEGHLKSKQHTNDNKYDWFVIYKKGK